MGVVGFFRSLVSRDANFERKLRKARALLKRNKPLHAEGAIRACLKLEPTHPECHTLLFRSWILRGDPHKVKQFCADLTHQESLCYAFELETATSMQRNALRKDTFLRFLQAPKEGSARLEHLERLRHSYPKWGQLSLLIVKEHLSAKNVEKLTEGLGYLRDASPEIPLDTIKTYYFLRDKLILDIHPSMKQELASASALQDPMERVRRLIPLAADSPNVAMLQFDLGMAYFQAGQPKTAVRYLSRAVGINPLWQNAWIQLGYVSLCAGRIVRSREAFVCAKWDKQMRWNHKLIQQLNFQLRDNPSLPSIEYGLQRFEMGDYSGARECFLEAISITPEHRMLQYLLGLSLFQTGEFKAALDPLLETYASELVDSNPVEKRRLAWTLERCCHLVTNLLVERNNVKDAMSLLQEVLFLNPEFELLREDIGLLKRLQAGKLTANAYLAYQRAHSPQSSATKQHFSYLKEALESHPDFTEARLSRAAFLADSGSLQDAREELERLRSSVLFSELVDFHVAGISWQEGDIEGAKQAWRKCVSNERLPWSTLAQSNLEALSQGVGPLRIVSLPQVKRQMSVQTRG